jgi:hypothetical protein
MGDPSKELALREPRVRELLLGHLLQAEGLLWPGGDALTLDDVVRDYVQLAAAGRVPGCQELQRRHPEFTILLNTIFQQ